MDPWMIWTGGFLSGIGIGLVLRPELERAIRAMMKR